MSGAMGLRLAYLAFSLGLLVFGAVLGWLGLRRPPRPAGRALRLVIACAILAAVAGATAAAVLEARVPRP
jgi:hypothetical protein